MHKGPFTIGSDVSVVFNASDAEKTPNQFMLERYRAFIPSGDACTFIGSSSLYQNKSLAGSHHVCDAFHLKTPVFNGDFTVLAQRTAVADGLGYSEDDEEFNNSLAKIASAVSQSFVELPVPPVVDSTQVLKLCTDVLKHSSPKEQSKSAKQYHSECSISTGMLSGDDKQWSGSFINIGDGMIVVLDKNTLKPKHIAPATIKHRSRGNYSPESVQELTKRPDETALQATQLLLNEDDIVIFMTDGIYSSFSLQVQDSPVTEESWGEMFPVKRFIKITDDAFDEALAPLKGKANISASDIAFALLQKQVSYFLLEFHKNKQLLKKLQVHINAKDALLGLTLAEFLDYLQEHDPDLQVTLHTYLHSAGLHDGVTFIPTKSLVEDLIRVLTTQEYGDCSTLSVVKVPSFKKELIKSYLETHNPFVLQNITKLMSLEECRAIIESMHQDEYSAQGLPTDGVLLKDLIPSKQYSSHLLLELLKTIQSAYSGKGFGLWNKFTFQLEAALPYLSFRPASNKEENTASSSPAVPSAPASFPNKDNDKKPF